MKKISSELDKMNWNEKMNTCNFKSTFHSKKKCFCGTHEHQVKPTLPSNTLCDGPEDDYIDFYDVVKEISKKNKREYETLPNSVSRIIVESAEKELRDLRLNADGCKLAKFSYEELEIGPLLGSGGFSSVYEIVNINPKKSGESNLCIEESNLRQAMIEYFYDNCSLLRSPLAIKMLQKKHVDNPKKFANGAIDLTLEAAFLSSLDHPNILKLRGISKEGIEGYYGGRHNSYFLIIDRLTETLQDRIMAWRKMHAFNRKWTRLGIFFNKCTKANSSMLERLKVATSVASALTYLHSRRLIYRDLKPTNIGFDINGQVQIFDFGLCCELPAEATQDLHRLPGGIGTHGYMSPEVAQHKPYNQGADVFSFGVLLYELMSLDRLPTLESNPRIVDTSALRACSCWPDSLRKILVKSLSSIVSERPAMAELLTILTETVSKLETIIRHRKGNNKSKRFNSEGLSIHHFMDNTISF